MPSPALLPFASFVWKVEIGIFGFFSEKLLLFNNCCALLGQLQCATGVPGRRGGRTNPQVTGRELFYLFLFIAKPLATPAAVPSAWGSSGLDLLLDSEAGRANEGPGDRAGLSWSLTLSEVFTLIPAEGKCKLCQLILQGMCGPLCSVIP